jgi:hypothetical protein
MKSGSPEARCGRLTRLRVRAASVIASRARAAPGPGLLGSPKLRRLAVRPASRLGPEPWLSLVSVAVGLAAGATGGVIPQLAPNIPRSAADGGSGLCLALKPQVGGLRSGKNPESA